MNTCLKSDNTSNDGQIIQKSELLVLFGSSFPRDSDFTQVGLYVT